MPALLGKARFLAAPAVGAIAAFLTVTATAQDTAAPAAAPPAADAAPAAAPQPGMIEESVVASVNDDVITNYDIGQRTRLLAVTAGIQPTRDDLAQMQQYALSSLIDERLELQELGREEKEQKFSIIATDADVDDEIAGMAKSNNISTAQLLGSLAQQGIGADTLRAQLRAQISWRRWIQGRYGSRLRVGEDEIKAFQAHMAAEAGKPKYQINEIFIDDQKAGSADRAAQEADQLAAQLRQGAPFAAVAKQFSAASTAANGGDAGWVTAGDYPPEVRAAVDGMRPGTLSAPIVTKDGVYLIFLRDKQAGGSSVLISLKQAAIALPADASQDQVDAARAKLEALKPQLHGCDNFEQIAGKVDGVLAGDLGEAQANELAPAFRDTALALPVGQISDPVRSDQGLHLLVVCNKRNNTAEGLDHDEIENELYGKQLVMIAKRYIRDLRNSAAIDFHTEQAGS